METPAEVSRGRRGPLCAFRVSAVHSVVAWEKDTLLWRNV
jgi:hypothetical protein